MHTHNYTVQYENTHIFMELLYEADPSRVIRGFLISSQQDIYSAK